MTDNVIEDLSASLKSLRTYLDTNIATIAPAIMALRSLAPEQLDIFLRSLNELIVALKTQLQALDTGGIPGLDETAEFSSRVHAVASAAQPFLPGQSELVTRLQDSASVIAALPALEDARPKLIDNIDAIRGHLAGLIG